MPESCHVIGCSKPSVSKGLCDTHRKQVARHGALGTLRPDDWGDRRKHPAYPTWKVLRRSHADTTDPRWLKDFWVFASEVPPKPDGVRATGWRPDDTKNWGPENFYWKEPRFGHLTQGMDRREYMRQWAQSNRDASPNYFKDMDLRRTYGVDLAWYNDTHAAQNGLCAICERPETLVIRGRTMSLAVDHCHVNEHVRGLLCSECNRGIGLLRDDVNLLRAAVKYLEKHAPDDVSDLL